jgi:hypothetical protein
MLLLADVLKSNGVALVGRQELENGQWLLLIGPPGAVSYPTPLYPSYILYAETRDPTEVSDDIAGAIHR